MKAGKLIYILIVACFFLPAHSQSLNIRPDAGSCQPDEQNKIILFRIDSIEKYADLSVYQEIKICLETGEYSFTPIPDQLEYSKAYTVTKDSENYTLYFTQLPLISITADSTIVDEPKILAEFSYSDDKVSFSSYIGIEIRGGVSRKYPKKTFDMEFWTDRTGETKRPVKFGELRLDDDWVLDALYNEPLRLRSYLAHNLWLQMHQPHYLDSRPEAKAGAEVMFVEVFLNGSYNGVYILSEQVDKKLLQLEDYDGTIRGELYKAISWGKACTFDALPDYSNSSRLWGGYLYKYPEEFQATNWYELYDFTDFVIFSSDNEFKADIWKRFNKENCMDYYMFLNLIRAGDNRGKNIYVGKVDVGEPYFYSPWDLDACFGTMWRGDNDPRTDNILTNGLFRKAINLDAGGFKTDMGNKWHALRDSILSTANLEDYFNEAYLTLTYNNVYARESIVYPNYDFSESSFEYMINWLNDRLAFLDTYFVKTGEYHEEDPEEDLTTNLESHNCKTLIYPNPADDYICIMSENEHSGSPYKIYDLTGKIVLHGTLDANRKIDLTGISSGLYLIKFSYASHQLIVR